MIHYQLLSPVKPLNGEIRLPASKSISNRLLIMQQLSDNRITISNLSKSNDTGLLVSLLEKVRQSKGESDSDNFCVLNCDNAGTVFRFLMAFLAMTPGHWLLTGSDRMQQRPVDPLFRALSNLGAKLSYASLPGFPPVRIAGNPLTGGRIAVDVSLSSQFVTALMIIAPLLEKGLHIKMVGEVASQPYIEMTLELMRQAGAETFRDGRYISIVPGTYCDSSFIVEPDWSAASYWYEAVALTTGSEILLSGLFRESVQGDAVLTDIFEQLGVRSQQTEHGMLISRVSEPATRFEYNFIDCPDVVPAVAATCVALNVEALLSGLKNLRIKESDRLQALFRELSNMNPRIKIVRGDSLLIPKQDNTTVLGPLHFCTYNDHRMAMAFAPLASVFDQISLDQPEAVSKSYPGFWEDLERVGFRMTGNFNQD